MLSATTVVHSCSSTTDSPYSLDVSDPRHIARNVVLDLSATFVYRCKVNSRLQHCGYPHKV